MWHVVVGIWTRGTRRGARRKEGQQKGKQGPTGKKKLDDACEETHVSFRLTSAALRPGSSAEELAAEELAADELAEEPPRWRGGMARNGVHPVTSTDCPATDEVSGEGKPAVG